MTNAATKTRRIIANTVASARDFGIDISLIDLIRYLKGSLSVTNSGTEMFALAHGLITPAPGRRTFELTRSGRFAIGGNR